MCGFFYIVPKTLLTVTVQTWSPRDLVSMQISFFHASSVAALGKLREAMFFVDYICQHNIMIYIHNIYIIILQYTVLLFFQTTR